VAGVAGGACCGIGEAGGCDAGAGPCATSDNVAAASAAPTTTDTRLTRERGIGIALSLSEGAGEIDDRPGAWPVDEGT
jgi:hypothetical protein